jgi:hypothetical protein
MMAETRSITGIWRRRITRVLATIREPPQREGADAQ